MAPYSDVPTTSPFCGSIDWLWTEGVTTGTLGGKFAPSGTVTRGMMAAFLHRFHLARTTPLGVDVGWPQCPPLALPSDHAFGIVGLNCRWPRDCQLLLGRPAGLGSRHGRDAATEGADLRQHGEPRQPGCGGQLWPCETLTAPCAQYGAARAQEDLDQVVAEGLDPAGYVWWLDVEAANSWETGTNGLTRNRAVLEGMVSTLSGGVGGIGLYASRGDWASIVGSVPTGSNLRGLPSWLTAAIGIGPARRMCAEPPLTPGGSVEMVQILEDGELDRDYVCPRQDPAPRA